jgi:hypothetical protein
MTKILPTWAIENATVEDRERVVAAQRDDTLQIQWPATTGIRGWAKEQGWSSSWFSFESRFMKRILANDADFALAINESGIALTIPKQIATISDERLQELDAEYANRQVWWALVASLREIRRMIEMDIDVAMDGRIFKEVGSFLTWAHQRYPMLEEGYDSWIGDDKS